MKKAETKGMDWERARTEEQKEIRISEIVAATARLYEHHSFEEISFTSIAKEADFTRSNLYKYFSSKEEIFLEFLKHDFADYRMDLERTFESKREMPLKEFAQLWVTVLVRNKRLLKLFSILNTFIEKNVSFEALIEFKRTLLNEVGTISALLSQTFPALTAPKTVEFILLQSATANGLYQICDQTEIQKKVMEREEFAVFRVDFTSSLQRTVEFIIRGLIE